MAQKVQVILTDDVDGGEADETVLFGLDGKSYEIDLSEKNAKKLRDALATYKEKGRRSRGQRKATAASSHSGRNPDTAKIREWAKEQGYDISERGRVPHEIQEAYAKAK